MHSSMLEWFRKGVASYQPEINGLVLESGDPRASLENVHRLTTAGLLIRDIWVSPNGALVMFSTGEQYYAPGLRVGGGPATEALARIAAEAGFGPFERLLPFYNAMPADYDDQLPDVEVDESEPESQREPHLSDGMVP
jgi:hypothetical protein